MRIHVMCWLHVDDTACNFDPEATISDFAACVADEGYDCSGACLNDADGDGICDELEIEVAPMQKRITTTVMQPTTTVLVHTL